MRKHLTYHMPAITEENETQLRIESTMSLSTQQTDVKSRIHIISLVHWIARHTLNSLVHVGDKDAYHESDNSNPSSSPSSKLETKSVSTLDDPIGLHNVKSEYICGAKETKIKTKIRLGSYGFKESSSFKGAIYRVLRMNIKVIKSKHQIPILV